MNQRYNWAMAEQELPSLVYPCDFPLKIIGLYNETDDFKAFVSGILVKHIPEIDPQTISHRFSGGGKYISIHANFIAQSRQQVDDLYRELSSHKRVLMLI